MQRVLAVARGVGAHPSYPDREGFGRRTIEMALPDVTATIAEQCARLAALASVTYVKPHGALYHDANRDPRARRGAARRRDARARRRRHRDRSAARTRCARPPRPPGCATCARASRIARCAPTAASCRAASPARSSPIRHSRRRACASWRRITTPCASTPTRRARSRSRRAVFARALDALDWVPLGDRAIRFARPPGVVGAGTPARGACVARRDRCGRRARGCRRVLRGLAAPRASCVALARCLLRRRRARARSRAACDLRRRGSRRRRARDRPVDRRGHRSPRARDVHRRHDRLPARLRVSRRARSARSCCRAARRRGRACPPVRSRSPTASPPCIRRSRRAAGT